jgi:hypothetical protein
VKEESMTDGTAFVCGIISEKLTARPALASALGMVDGSGDELATMVAELMVEATDGALDVLASAIGHLRSHVTFSADPAERERSREALK